MLVEYLSICTYTGAFASVIYPVHSSISLCVRAVKPLERVVPKSHELDQMAVSMTIYLLLSSADNLCKQFGPRSCPTKRRA